ncbi:MAG: alpha-amylase family glycosyl hydrolase [Phycisphaerae bacterium]
MNPGKTPHRRAYAALAVFAFVLVGGPAPAAAENAWPPAPPLKAEPDRHFQPPPPSVRVEPTDAGRWRCTFEYQPDAAGDTVHLAGTFNNWSRSDHALGPPDAAGVRRVTLDLGSGAHEYKFVVNGERWLADPRNPETADDRHGGANSLLRLGRLASLKRSAAKAGDGAIDPYGLEHDPALPLYLQVSSPTELILRFRTLAHDVERVAVAAKDGPTADLFVVHEDGLFALWEGTLKLPPVAAGPPRSIDYAFVLADGATRASAPRTYTERIMKQRVFHTPDWAKHAIWYQIMPDRFRNGDPANDPPQTREWTSEWFRPAAWEGKDGQTFYKWYVFARYYGGDFRGIEQKLDYLKDLGVNALYFNPVFQGDSHHKYNATSYVHIDDDFGVRGAYAAAAARETLDDPATWTWSDSDRVFLDFLKQAKARGFRVIIDGVFNHVGTLHPAYQDVKKNRQQSRYADWFDVASWEPFKIYGWGGFDALPAFKKSPDGLASEAVVKHIFDITRRWMDPDGDGDPRDGVDGWRLDVPNEIPLPFWQRWRDHVKRINPDAYITGEIWQRADAWLDGRSFDAVMNYEFARPVIEWACFDQRKIKPTELDRRLNELRLAYPVSATLVMQNLVDSHDTDRLVSMVQNPDRPYDEQNRVQDNNPRYDNSKPGPEAYRRARLVVLVQMTYVGAPMVYYGDEAGMWGADDPTNRKPMLWEDLEPYEKPDENVVMKDHLAFYREAIALRNAYPALRVGAFRTLLADDDADVWAFQRRTADERLIVVLNAADQPRTVRLPLPDDAPDTWKYVFGGSDGARVEQRDGSAERTLIVEVSAIGGAVLHAGKQ